MKIVEKTKTKLQALFRSLRRSLSIFWSNDDIAVNTFESVNSRLRKIRMSKAMVQEFVKIAKPNTKSELETGAALAGKLINGEYYVTALYIPLQICQTDSYEALREEHLLNYCEKHSLIHLGSIHTHPMQKCYLSSIDLHNHFWFQNELPEAISIVVAPTDFFKKYGVFRITDPGGMSVIRECKKSLTGFHSHEKPHDGGPIYHDCSNNVILDSTIQFCIEDMHFYPRRN